MSKNDFRIVFSILSNCDVKTICFYHFVHYEKRDEMFILLIIYRVALFPGRTFPGRAGILIKISWEFPGIWENMKTACFWCPKWRCWYAFTAFIGGRWNAIFHDRSMSYDWYKYIVYLAQLSKKHYKTSPQVDKVVRKSCITIK